MKNAKRHFKAAVYVRLSKEDGDVADAKKAESNSISNQKSLVFHFLEGREDIEVVSVHEDDGYTGSNFDRPGFRRMMEEIETGKADCVVVKDDCVKIGLNRKSLIESRFSRRSPISLTGKTAA